MKALLTFLLAGLVTSQAAVNLINTGAAANDGTGDTLRQAFLKSNTNFLTLSNSAALAGTNKTQIINTAGDPRTAYAAVTPASANLIGLGSFGGGTGPALFFNGPSTTLGDWLRAPHFLTGLGAIGSSDNMDTNFGHQLPIHVNGSPSGRRYNGDSGVIFYNWSTNAVQSGNLVTWAVMSSETGDPATSISDNAFSMGTMPTNRIPQLLPGWGQLAINHSFGGPITNNMRGFAIASPQIGPDAGNYSLLMCDAINEMTVVPKWVAGKYQPQDGGFLYTAAFDPSAGRVGIGLNTMDSLFQVRGDLLSAGNAAMRIAFNGTSANYFDGDTQNFRNGTPGSETNRFALGSTATFSVPVGVGVGVTADSYFRVAGGSGATSAGLRVGASSTSVNYLDGDLSVIRNAAASVNMLKVEYGGGTSIEGSFLSVSNGSGQSGVLLLGNGVSRSDFSNNLGTLSIQTSNSAVSKIYQTTAGVAIGTNVAATPLDVMGTTSDSSATAVSVRGNNGVRVMSVRNDGLIQAATFSTATANEALRDNSGLWLANNKGISWTDSTTAFANYAGGVSNLIGTIFVRTNFVVPVGNAGFGTTSPLAKQDTTNGTAATVVAKFSQTATNDIAQFFTGTTPQFRVATNGLWIGTCFWGSGAGSPESAVTAPPGSHWMRTDGGAGTSEYTKESGTGNTGWVAK